MPLITVLNFGYRFNQGTYHAEATRALQVACRSIRELKLRRKRDVTVCILDGAPQEALDRDDPIIITVDLLFRKPERTLEVQRRLAKELGEAMKVCRPNRNVEVAVFPFDPERSAFWSN